MPDQLQTRRCARLLALAPLVCAILSAPLPADVLAHEAALPATVGDSYEPVRALGPVKRASHDLLRVKLRDNTTVVTHGLDPEPTTPDRLLDSAGPERQPVCASDYHQHLLYGYPSGATNRLSSVKGMILAEIRRVNAILNDDALASGGKTADYKVLCDGAGEIKVDSFQSSEAAQQTSFAGVVSAAKRAGFDASNADYTIFFDSLAPPGCGTASFADDQRPIAGNKNNSGRGYAVVYSDCWTNRSVMHENGHNQGAVQDDAPYSTGSGSHCNDGYDVMCYSDGGDKDVGVTVLCPDKLHFDCRHDTYFDTAPEPGEYLAQQWNLGSPLNRFISFDNAGPRRAACEDGVDNDGDGRTDFPNDPGCKTQSDLDELDELHLPECVDLLDNDGDGKKDFLGDPGCSWIFDDDESDPPRVIDRTEAAADARALQERRLPTLTMATARRYARQRIRRKSPRATRIKTSCSRRTRTSATCRVRWRARARGGYRGSMVVKYRLRGGRAVLVATSRLRSYG